MQIASTWYQSIIRHIKTKFSRRKSVLPRRPDEAEAVVAGQVVAVVEAPAVGAVLFPERDGTA